MSGYLRSVTEEGQTPLTCAGMYFFKHAIGIYEALSSMVDNDFRVDGEFQLVDAIEGMLGSGFLFKYSYIDKVYDIGTPERLELARQDCYIKKGKP
jgi:UTP-glucose-1-phosphate uridylyltransferase